MLHLSEFVRTLRSSVLVVFNNFLLREATDKNKISRDQKRFFIALSLYPLSFFANTPFNAKNIYITGNMLQCFKVQFLIYIFIYGVPKKPSEYEPCLDTKYFFFHCYILHFVHFTSWLFQQK